MFRLALNLLAALALSPFASAEDAMNSLRPWVSIGDLNLRDLANGKIATSANAAMNLPRGMSCEAVYVVKAPLDVTHAALLRFNSTKHPELEVYQHHVFQGETDASFENLQLNPKDKPTSALIGTMGSPGEIQLSKQEAALMPRTRTADATQAFLSGVMRDRWRRFSGRGDFGSMGIHDAGSEIRSLLGEETKLTRHFAALLSPLISKIGAGTPKFHYWDLSVVDKKAAVQLGAVYGLEMPERRQVVDVTWFSSNAYLVALTVYEMQPVTIDGKPMTLVWQGSMVSTTGIEGGFGIKRKIGSRMMVSDVEKWIGIFRRDAEKGGR